MAREAAGAKITPRTRGAIYFGEEGRPSERRPKFAALHGECARQARQSTRQHHTDKQAPRRRLPRQPPYRRYSKCSDGEPFGGRAKPAQPSRTLAKNKYRPDPVMQATRGSSGAQQQAHKDAKAMSDKCQHDADMRRLLERIDAMEKAHSSLRLRERWGVGEAGRPDERQVVRKVAGLAEHA